MAGFPLSFLTERILQSINNTDENGVVSAGRTTNSALLEMIDNLSNGETIIGKVLSVSEDSFKILTQDNLTLSAKNQDGVSLKTGTSVLFEVCKSTGNQVVLKPLCQNTNEANTQTLALRQAGIPVNERTIEFVARKMEYGEPIDRVSLYKSYPDIADYPQASVKYIVDLQQMNIPVNENNLSQYENYMNMENSITEGIMNISDAITLEVSNLSMANPSDLTGFLETMRTVVNDSTLSDSGSYHFSSETLAEMINEIRETGLSSDNLEALFLSGKKDIEPSVVLNSLINDIEYNNQAIVDDSGINKLLGDINGVVYDRENAEGMSDEIINLPDADTKDAPLSRENLNLIINSAFRESLQKTFLSKTSIDKDHIQDKDFTRQLYERLFLETNKLLSELGDKLADKSLVNSSINNLSSNIDFMNSLNNFVPYIQIPFQNDGNKNTAELYVLKNRHSLTSKDSKVTAFIHLDMNNLGPTDIFVELMDKNITTNFTLQDDECLKLIEDNISFLNKRITDRGYSFSCKLNQEKSLPSPIETMLQNTTNRMLLSKTSFDARV